MVVTLPQTAYYNGQVSANCRAAGQIARQFRAGRRLHAGGKPLALLARYNGKICYANCAGSGARDNSLRDIRDDGASSDVAGTAVAAQPPAMLHGSARGRSGQRDHVHPRTRPAPSCRGNGDQLRNPPADHPVGHPLLGEVVRRLGWACHSGVYIVHLQRVRVAALQTGAT